MKKNVHNKLQLKRMTVRLLDSQLNQAGAGPTAGTTNYSMRETCSSSCMCSLPCSVDSCAPCPI